MDPHAKLIDTSKHNHPINVAKVVAAGIDGVILRAGNGIRVDSTVFAEAEKWRAVGIPVGTYWFCNPKASNAGKQANLHAEVHRQIGARLPAMGDFEWYDREAGDRPVIYGAELMQWQIGYLTTLDANLERRSIFYSNAGYWNAMGLRDDLADRQAIIAHWPVYPSQRIKNDPKLLAEWMRTCPKPPAPEQWAEWAYAQRPRGPQLFGGLRQAAGWQFSAEFNQQGKHYGAASRDLDLVIVPAHIFSAWLAGTVTPRRPTLVTNPTIDQEDDDDMERIRVKGDNYQMVRAGLTVCSAVSGDVVNAAIADGTLPPEERLVNRETLKLYEHIGPGPVYEGTDPANEGRTVPADFRRVETPWEV